jgi:hypothetical protein
MEYRNYYWRMIENSREFIYYWFVDYLAMILVSQFIYRKIIGFFFWIYIFFIDTFVSLAIPSLQLRLTTSLFSSLDSKLKTNSQYLSIDQCRVLVLIC